MLCWEMATNSRRRSDLFIPSGDPLKRIMQHCVWGNGGLLGAVRALTFYSIYCLVFGISPQSHGVIFWLVWWSLPGKLVLGSLRETRARATLTHLYERTLQTRSGFPKNR